jgi:HD-like signal output (HDOD) protein
MSLLKRFFGSKDAADEPRPSRSTEGRSGKPSKIEAKASERRLVPSNHAPITISAEILNSLFPIRNLSDEVRSAFSIDRTAEVCGVGSVLFSRGEKVDSVYYLLEGSVLMELGEGTSYQVHADTAKARFPLCAGQCYSGTAHALTDVQFLRVSPKIMSGGCEAGDKPLSLDLSSLDVPESVRQSHLFQSFCQHFADEALKVPTLPDVAVKLRKAMESDVGMEEVARIVQMDAAIAAKLVHVANSPLYLSINTIQTCQDAIVRLGLAATRNLVVSYSLRQIFQCRDPFINQLLRAEWKKSINLSCLCWVLASENGDANPSEAQLAGLTADIGVVPFLYYVENLPRDYWSPEELDTVIPYIRGPVGAFVLSQLNFPPELVNIPSLAEAWLHDSGPTLTLSDIVMMSRLHSYIGTPKMAEVPAINSVPACSKLRKGELTPELTLKVLHEAKDKINQSLKLFEG